MKTSFYGYNLLSATLLFSLNLLPLSSVTVFAGTHINYEKPAVLQATKLINEIPLKGKHYTISEKVSTDGFLMKFTVQSDFGSFYPQSPDLLKTTLIEITAMEKLEKFSKSELFVEGVKKSGKEIGNELKTLITDPVETAKGIGDGIDRFFQRTSRTTKTGLQKLGDKIFEEEQNELDKPNLVAKVPGASSDANNISTESNIVEASARMAGNTAINILGYSEQRRHIAKQLSVDPYTTNKELAEKLDEIAWASFSGGLGVSALKVVLPATMVVSMSTTLSDWVWDLPPGDLRVYNEEKLLAMGVAQETIDNFLKHRWYTFTLQGRLVRSLVQMKGVKNQPDVLALALTVNSEAQARFVTESVEMLAAYHKLVAPLKSLAVFNTIVAYGKTGQLIVPVPLDYVSWTKKLDTFTSLEKLNSQQRLIYLRGVLSSTAKKELTQKGWIIQENVIANGLNL